MFRLALIFFGGDALIRRWTFFVMVGVLAGLCGMVLLVDLLDGVADIAAKVLGAALLLQGLFELVAGTAHTRLRRRLSSRASPSAWKASAIQPPPSASSSQTHST